MRCWLLVLSIASLACSGDKQAGKQEPAPPTGLEEANHAKRADEAADKTAPADPESPGAEAASSPAVAALPQLLKNQGVLSRFDVEFVGFSKDGRLYAVDSYIGEDDDDTAEYTVREVYAAERGGYVRRFIMKKKLGRLSRRLRALEAEAEPREAWAAFEDEWQFVKAPKDRSRGPWSLEIVRRKNTVTKLTAFDTKKAGDGFVAVWEYYKTPRTQKERDWVIAHEGKKLRQRSPRFQVHASGGDKSWLLLETGAPFKRDELIIIDEEANVESTVVPYWSPDGSQVVLVVQHRPNLDIGVYPPSSHAYLRTLGPQIKVVAAGANPIAVATFLSKLRSKKIPLVQFENAKDPSAAQKVYYRRDSQALAKTIASWMPGNVAVDKLEKDGWIDIIVFLGSGAD